MFRMFLMFPYVSYVSHVAYVSYVSLHCISYVSICFVGFSCAIDEQPKCAIPCVCIFLCFLCVLCSHLLMLLMFRCVSYVFYEGDVLVVGLIIFGV